MPLPWVVLPSIDDGQRTVLREGLVLAIEPFCPSPQISSSTALKDGLFVLLTGAWSPSSSTQWWSRRTGRCFDRLRRPLRREGRSYSGNLVAPLLIASSYL